MKSHISEMLNVILLKFGLWRLMLVGMSTVKIIVFRKGSMELRMRENRVFFLPLDILMMWRAGFCWAAHCTIMCFDHQ